jgi:hypothetical protein
MSFKSIIENLLANFIWLLLAAIFTVPLKYYDRLSGPEYLILAINFGLVMTFMWYRNRFHKITGIQKVEPHIAGGTQPTDALKLCKNNFKFLGIAANKFLFTPEFEAAVLRCNRAGEPIKFLLSSPGNPIIKQMARRAGRDEDEFRNMIIATIKKLKMLKFDHGYNIEVRLYRSSGDSGPPSFRLFFIDNSSVLVSYYLMGEGNGSQMPQMIIRKPDGKNEVENFYFAFDHYFNSLWENSEQCDFNKIN